MIKIKSVLFFILYFLVTTFLNVPLAFAFSKSDDIIYNVTYEAGYEYGDVKTCTRTSGIAWFEGIKTANGHKVCLWNDAEVFKNSSGGKFECADSSMEKFALPPVKGSDGKAYYGYGCRKPSDTSKIEYEERTLSVGSKEYLGNFYNESNPYIGYTCSIMSGDSVEIGNCQVTAIKTGTTTIKVKNNSSNEVRYYKYIVEKPLDTLDELPKDYTYSNYEKCDLGYYDEEQITVGGINFCTTTSSSYNFERRNFKCGNEYDAFKVTFNINGKIYKGYGCRKPKDYTKVETKEAELTVGFTTYIGSAFNDPNNYSSYTCSVVSGDSVTLGYEGSCHVTGKKVGVSIIRTMYNGKSDAVYWKVTVKEASSNTNELPNEYIYGNVSSCNLGSYSNGKKIKFNNLNFCGSSLPGYDYEGSATCEQSDYYPFKVAFSVDGVSYKGYGCRTEKIYESRNLGIGISEQLVSSPSATCSIVRGNSVTIENCKVTGFEEGTTIVKVESGGEIRFYSYNVTFNGGGGSAGDNPTNTDDSDKGNRLNYDSWCSADNKANLGIRKAFKTIGYVVILLKWLVPLLIIIFGMIDFGKAVISSDDKAISKASSSLIKRIIAGVVIFLVPTIIPSIIGLLEITNGIEEKDNTNFGACTRCMFDPINDCEINDK